MRRFLALAALFLAAPLRAALVVPEMGLPEGRLSPGSALGLAYQPLAAERWTALQNVVVAGGDVRVAPWTSLPKEQAMLAAAPLQMMLSEAFWAQAAGFSALTEAQRAELIASLAFAQPRVSSAVDKRAPRALEDAQRLIEQGRFGEADLEWLAATLETMSVHGERSRAAALEARAALALSKARREAAALASKQDPGAVAGRASEASAPLAKPSGEKAPAERAPVPAPTPVGSKHWIVKVGLITLATYLADIGTKAYAHAHLFSVFHEVAWRKPLMMFIIPYILFTAITALVKLPRAQQDLHWNWRRVGSRGAGLSGWLGFTKETLPGLDEVARTHPSIHKAFSHFEVAAGFMLGGLLGNGIDAILKNGALDWIPVGRSLMNFSDVAILLGLSYFQLASIFFTSAARAARDKKHMALDLTNFLGLPILGFFVAWAFGSAQGGGALDLAMKNIGFIYLMGFSMLIGIARFVAALLIRGDVKRFNDGASAAIKKLYGKFISMFAGQ